MVLAWKNLQEVFVMLPAVVVFTSMKVFHSLLFDVIPHFWAFPSQFYRQCYGFQRTFLPTGVFLPYNPSTVTQMQAGTPHPGSSSVPALTELFLPAGAWTWTTHIVVTRPLIYQLRQWATKIELKLGYWICFACSKSYRKTIKLIWTRLDENYCLKLIRQNCTSKLFWRSSHPVRHKKIINV